MTYPGWEGERRPFTGPLPVPHLPDQHFERHAQVALLWTARDRPSDWLRAGQALERVLLTATAHGVRTSMPHQAMEWPDLWAAACPPQRRCCPQLLIRFGHGPDGGRTPRGPAGTTRHRGSPGLGDITPAQGWLRPVSPLEPLSRRARLSTEVARVRIDFTQYAEADYFHDGEDRPSLAAILGHAPASASAPAPAQRGQTARRPDVRLTGGVLASARDDLAGILDQRFL
ncbi:hypothetical protein ACWDE9_38855, partial [Streptomyces olivaceoviridis]